MTHIEGKKTVFDRRSIRMPDYDYSGDGGYFVTICVNKGLSIFGKISEGKLQMSDAGEMIKQCWKELERKFPMVVTDEFVVMPNYFHGIIIISHVGADLRVCPKDKGAHTGAPLHSIIQWFKTMTTNEYIRNVKNSNWQPFTQRLWQRNYYERVIRSDRELNNIRQYIADNPGNWNSDRENPNAIQSKGNREKWQI